MIKFKGRNTKFKKRQRLSIYKAALKFLKEHFLFRYGLCLAVNEVTGRTYPDKGEFSDIINFFPEIIKRKPKNANFFWFPLSLYGIEKRINLLKEAIEELEDSEKLIKVKSESNLFCNECWKKI